MIVKFKNILKESTKKKKAEELARHLRSDKWYNGKPLYRGSERKLDTWTVKEPYESRSPMTTDKTIQWFTEVFRKLFYPNYPSRDKSRFASTKKNFAKNYGDLYYVFPHESSIVGSINDDAYLGFLGPAGTDFEEFYHNMEKLRNKDFNINTFKESVPEEVVVLCQTFVEAKSTMSEGSSKKLENLLKYIEGVNNIKDLAKKIDNDKFYVDLEDQSSATEESLLFLQALRSLADFLHHMSDYFTSMKVGKIIDDASEIVIHGKLIQANKIFIDNYFEKTNQGFEYKRI